MRIRIAACSPAALLLVLAGCESNPDAPSAPPSVVVSDMEKSPGEGSGKAKAKAPANPSSVE